MKDRKKTNALFVAAFVVVASVGALFLAFNEYGYTKYETLNDEIEILKREMKRLERENEELKASIDSLEMRVPSAVEKVAREEYGMREPNEDVIVVETK
jgi:cell division protein FtsL